MTIYLPVIILLHAQKALQTFKMNLCNIPLRQMRNSCNYPLFTDGWADTKEQTESARKEIQLRAQIILTQSASMINVIFL